MPTAANNSDAHAMISNTFEEAALTSQLICKLKNNEWLMSQLDFFTKIPMRSRSKVGRCYL